MRKPAALSESRSAAAAAAANFEKELETLCCNGLIYPPDEHQHRQCEHLLNSADAAVQKVQKGLWAKYPPDDLTEEEQHLEQQLNAAAQLEIAATKVFVHGSVLHSSFQSQQYPLPT